MAPRKGRTTPTKAAAETVASTTNRRGKQTTTTAATDRPRRVSSTTVPTVAEKGAPEAPNIKKKRGRPAKSAEIEPPKKRSRGAGVKPTVSEEAKDVDEEDDDDDDDDGKVAGVSDEETAPSANNVRSDIAPRRRGRPSKGGGTIGQGAAPSANVNSSDVAPRRRGRPPKAGGMIGQGAAPSTNVVRSDVAPRRRGRPPKGGETTQISTDAQAAAEQLEEELEEEQKVTKQLSPRKTQAPKKGKAKADKVNEDVGEDVAHSVENELPAEDQPDTDQRYWLMKAEQEDRMVTLKSGREFNTKFTIDDLRSKTVPEPWDGVRNAVAAKNMRQMKQGELAFFYHSGGKGSQKPGIVGIMEIVKEHEPDVTTADEDAYGYVEKESDRSRWCVVHVEFRKKLSSPVSLKELQNHAEGNGVLANMQVLKQTRLSVNEVTKKEWDFIVNNLIEGYDDDEVTTKEVKDSGDSENKDEVRVEIPEVASASARGKSNKEPKTNGNVLAKVKPAQADSNVTETARRSPR